VPDDVARGRGAFAGPAGGADGVDPFDPQALEREGGSGAGAQEPLPAGVVVAGDADGGVEAEAAGRLPGEQVLERRLLEEAASQEETQDAAAQRLLDAFAGPGRRDR